MTGGQGALRLDAEPAAARASGPGLQLNRESLPLNVVRATRAEIEAHERQLDLIEEASDDGAVWHNIDT
jgi:hypothetical protein